MGKAESLDRRVERHLQARLEQLRRASGLPVVLAGTATPKAEGRRLRITTLSGTIGRALLGLEVAAGQGIGGIVVSRAAPCRVDNYATARSITHDFDHIILGEEHIHSMFAMPVVVDGAVRCVFYGATRESRPIGDIALSAAGRIAASTAQDLARLTALEELPGAERPRNPILTSARIDRAVDELLAITSTVADHALRERLTRIIDDLGGNTRGPVQPRPDQVAITPRELDTLRLVELGASNAVIAEDLGLSLQTVKAYLSSAMRKLNASNRTSAVHTARAYGLL
ncbi:LuxR C-terminal-related transcriptional regulator [Rhodococcus sp. NPDC127530]|uniref:helix-turn-helix transcriptional regulator n=1 Tax=unclassified Rhodococcus (in: high G+C Gram-positive bacteria) TaxID=192944 RepID=UPI00364161EA